MFQRYKERQKSSICCFGPPISMSVKPGLGWKPKYLSLKLLFSYNIKLKLFSVFPYFLLFIDSEDCDHITQMENLNSCLGQRLESVFFFVIFKSWLLYLNKTLSTLSNSYIEMTPIKVSPLFEGGNLTTCNVFLWNARYWIKTPWYWIIFSYDRQEKKN